MYFSDSIPEGEGRVKYKKYDKTFYFFKNIYYS